MINLLNILGVIGLASVTSLSGGLQPKRTIDMNASTSPYDTYTISGSFSDFDIHASNSDNAFHYLFFKFADNSYNYSFEYIGSSSTTFLDGFSDYDSQAFYWGMVQEEADFCIGLYVDGSSQLVHTLSYSYVFNSDFVNNRLVRFEDNNFDLLSNLPITFSSPHTIDGTTHNTMDIYSIGCYGSYGLGYIPVSRFDGRFNNYLSSVSLVDKLYYSYNYSLFPYIISRTPTELANRLTITSLNTYSFAISFSLVPYNYVSAEFQDGYDTGYALGLIEGGIQSYANGYADGTTTGYNTGYNAGYNVGYNDGYQEGTTQDDTAYVIFTGIIDIGLLPINIFLQILNFEVFGINVGALVSSLLTIAIVIILWRIVSGGKNND